MSPRAADYRRPPRPAPGWHVVVEAHELDRWRIAAQVVKVRAVDETHARMLACREAHREAGVPPWKPLARLTYLRTRVVRGQKLLESRSTDAAPASHNSGVSLPGRKGADE